MECRPQQECAGCGELWVVLGTLLPAQSYWLGSRLLRALGYSGPTGRGVSEPKGVSLPVALKFPLKCFFLFFKEKNIPKLENKGNPLPPNHTKLTLGAWRESMETRKPAVNPVRCCMVGWELGRSEPRTAVAGPP